VFFAPVIELTITQTMSL